MLVEEVVAVIKAGIPDAEVMVDGADCSFSVTVVSASFEGLSILKKQQAVMATVKEQIASGALHAISVNALTPAEWAAKQ